jgi:anti-sigma B factor antagonist
VSQLEVGTRKIPSGYLISLRGELDVSTADRLAQEVVSLEKQHPELLVIDMRDLEFVDSSGLRVIVAADVAARREYHRVVVVEGPEEVRRVFRHTLLDQRLNLVENPEEAYPEG